MENRMNYAHQEVTKSGPTDPYLYLWIDTGTWIEEHQCHKRYLGIHKGHLGYSYTGSGKHFKKAYDERPDDFKRIILKHDPDYKFLHKEETIVLKLVKARANTAWYNMHENCWNTSGIPQSEEHKAKIGAAQKGRQHSDRTKSKMSAAQMGNTARLGKKHTDETKAKMSAAKKGNPRSPLSEETRMKLKGLKRSEETKAKMSAAQKGKPQSEEHKAKLGASRRGLKRSEETKEKMRAARKNYLANKAKSNSL